jgi:DNA invertase Pin-like site-specific DNA recombinase
LPTSPRRSSAAAAPSPTRTSLAEPQSNPQQARCAETADGRLRLIWTGTASGALASRPQLDELLAYTQDGDTIVVALLDRLGRSLAHLVAIVTELGERGVGLRSLHEQLDTTSATGGSGRIGTCCEQLGAGCGGPVDF